VIRILRKPSSVNFKLFSLPQLNLAKGALILSLFFLAMSYSACTFSFFTSTKIKSDEYVLFFPSQAYQSKNKTEWVVEIHGWIFESNTADSIKHLFQGLFGISKNPSTKQFEKLMQQRVKWFFVDNERNKKLSIRLNGKNYLLNKSKSNGHFYGQIRLPSRTVRQWKLDHLNRINFRAVTQKNDNRTFTGSIQFVENTGLSIISDIDDTIKLSQVYDKTLLLKNTFDKAYSPIPGMAKSYNRWAKYSPRQQKTVFHYLSASPWQLYVPLSSFLRKNKFPYGSFQMKFFRFKDKTFLNLFKNSFEYKFQAIQQLLNRYPQRKFILVGDSGESDIKIYTEIARLYPHQIRAIYIHKVKSKHPQKQRAQIQAAKKLRCPVFYFETKVKSANLKLRFCNALK